MPDDEEKVGALATLGLNEIDVEIDEYPPHDGDGATIDFDPMEPSVDNPYDTKKPNQVPEDIMERVKRRYDGGTN